MSVARVRALTRDRRAAVSAKRSTSFCLSDFLGPLPVQSGSSGMPKMAPAKSLAPSSSCAATSDGDGGSSSGLTSYLRAEVSVEAISETTESDLPRPICSRELVGACVSRDAARLVETVTPVDSRRRPGSRPGTPSAWTTRPPLSPCCASRRPSCPSCSSPTSPPRPASTGSAVPGASRTSWRGPSAAASRPRARAGTRAPCADAGTASSR